MPRFHAALLSLTMLLSAQPQGQDRPTAPAAPTSQVPDRGRPTRLTDEVPPLDFAKYFVGGTWRFEWDIPEGVFGPAGTLDGTIEYRHIEGPFYEAITKGTGPNGPFTIREQIAYRQEGHTVTRLVTDSRGLEYLQTASVGGDLGGYYGIYYESIPIQVNGQTVRIKNALRLLSPARYRNNLTISIDGGPFVNYGNPWFEKVM